MCFLHNCSFTLFSLCSIATCIELNTHFVFHINFVLICFIISFLLCHNFNFIHHLYLFINNTETLKQLLGLFKLV